MVLLTLCRLECAVISILVISTEAISLPIGKEDSKDTLISEINQLLEEQATDKAQAEKQARKHEVIDEPIIVSSPDGHTLPSSKDKLDERKAKPDRRVPQTKRRRSQRRSGSPDGHRSRSRSRRHGKRSRRQRTSSSSDSSSTSHQSGT